MIEILNSIGPAGCFLLGSAFGGLVVAILNMVRDEIRFKPIKEIDGPTLIQLRKHLEAESVARGVRVSIKKAGERGALTIKGAFILVAASIVAIYFLKGVLCK